MKRRDMLKGLSAGSAATLVAASFSSNASSKLLKGSSLQPGYYPCCTLTPEQPEGPYYFDAGMVHRNITEGKPGVPLELELRVVDSTNGCQPITDAVVDIWHCDAQGLYSGYEGQGDSGDIDTTGETFLRGVQVTDWQGLVNFQTIYPGWYYTRATHIHLSVFLDAATLVTSQIYFPDEINESIYTNHVAYTGRSKERVTNNENDMLLTMLEDKKNDVFVEIGQDNTGFGFKAVYTIGVKLSS
ncbi:intradiol ring-cleavage dioxygenase [Spartinivicinus poritis]|uniref:Intradiol ring-cleavage dioxygenase n=1 Tax=Spartinivicinus poritis TaxID=2994640 RepID=A0ABT5UCL3_9GAMM|nr:intradiol ring-cleavage dioxygenase [Spartinivicinus sp. A2-2]MDE1464123.1 intradiol ring-cleavage dioxygenase [Spartinivicinus sp. A2-2]